MFPLAPPVEERDPPGGLCGVVVDVAGLAPDLGRQRPAGHARPRRDLRREMLGVEGGGGDHAALRTVGTQVLGERTGVDAGQAGDAEVRELVVQRALGTEVARARGELADDEP